MQNGPSHLGPEESTDLIAQLLGLIPEEAVSESAVEAVEGRVGNALVAVGEGDALGGLLRASVPIAELLLRTSAAFEASRAFATKKRKWKKLRNMTLLNSVGIGYLLVVVPGDLTGAAVLTRANSAGVVRYNTLLNGNQGDIPNADRFGDHLLIFRKLKLEKFHNPGEVSTVTDLDVLDDTLEGLGDDLGRRAFFRLHGHLSLGTIHHHVRGQNRAIFLILGSEIGGENAVRNSRLGSLQRSLGVVESRVRQFRGFRRLVDNGELGEGGVFIVPVQRMIRLEYIVHDSRLIGCRDDGFRGGRRHGVHTLDGIVANIQLLGDE